MAVINNLKTSFTSFKRNDIESKLINNVGTYGTTDILNGGELLDNTLLYTFNIMGLKDHTVKSITVRSLLLTLDGNLNTTKNLALELFNYGNKYSGNFITSDSVKTIISTQFLLIVLQEENILTIQLKVLINSDKSCFYGLQGIIIELYDIDYSIHLSFSGPNINRTASSITTAFLILNKNAVDVTFSKDPTQEFNKEVDSVEGRLYLKKDGIFVDGYLYGVNAPATENKQGIVKLSKSSFNPIYEEDEEGNLILVGIEAPTDTGVAASPLLVYNALASALSYTDEVIAPILTHVEGIQATLDGIEAPLIINIENNDGNIESLGDTLTFSNDFELKDNRLYIKWLEIS